MEIPTLAEYLRGKRNAQYAGKPGPKPVAIKHRVINLHKEGSSIQEIAQQLGCSERYVYMVLDTKKAAVG